jgi:PadR family transcriptional regulator, regulatory protein PadR
MLRDFFRGFIKIHILYHVSREEVYGVQFIDELARHGYQLSPGTLYPLLHSLEDSRYVEREDRIVDGKVRKYYRITHAGLDALQEARAKIRELVDEVLEEESPPVVRAVSRRRGVSDPATIVRPRSR